MIHLINHQHNYLLLLKLAGIHPPQQPVWIDLLTNVSRDYLNWLPQVPPQAEDRDCWKCSSLLFQRLTWIILIASLGTSTHNYDPMLHFTPPETEDTDTNEKIMTKNMIHFITNHDINFSLTFNSTSWQPLRQHSQLSCPFQEYKVRLVW